MESFLRSRHTDGNCIGKLAKWPNNLCYPEASRDDRKPRVIDALLFKYKFSLKVCLSYEIFVGHKLTMETHKIDFANEDNSTLNNCLLLIVSMQLNCDTQY